MLDDARRMNDDAMCNVNAETARNAGAARSPVLTVSHFVSSARLLLERQIGLLWIGGEISACARAASGHLYFTLKDEGAQVRCVFYRQRHRALRSRFGKAWPSRCAR